MRIAIILPLFVVSLYIHGCKHQGGSTVLGKPEPAVGVGCADGWLGIRGAEYTDKEKNPKIKIAFYELNGKHLGTFSFGNGQPEVREVEILSTGFTCDIVTEDLNKKEDRYTITSAHYKTISSQTLNETLTRFADPVPMHNGVGQPATGVACGDGWLGIRGWEYTDRQTDPLIRIQFYENNGRPLGTFDFGNGQPEVREVKILSTGFTCDIVTEDSNRKEDRYTITSGNYKTIFSSRLNKKLTSYKKPKPQ
jgi:hypothetical protein